jgi:hypothetical protein
VKNRGLVVITSCGHVGILNTIRQAQEVSGINKLHALIGEARLYRSGRRRAEDVCARLGGAHALQRPGAAAEGQQRRDLLAPVEPIGDPELLLLGPAPLKQAAVRAVTARGFQPLSSVPTRPIYSG